eukprot:TRINITY_DN55815_c0_g1_i1.p1 TRINITY_DN55815_c0_g1~~TRINITY_DN55815_c0_g1_i1.p1  ORF type:complete len:362 (-),score=96.44 TRINITY_DN55815_c0_g1_i1:347-1333(-)
MLRSLVGSEMCIRDSINAEYGGCCQNEMSEGYADRLKHYPNKGVCGLPETRDTARKLSVGISRLAELIRAANHLVVLTGAGISTSAGIPDFRGPTGIWTQQQEIEKATRARKRKHPGAAPTATEQEQQQPGDPVEFAAAQPSLTHYALAEMSRRGKLKFVVTQNVDKLHQQSGLPRAEMAVLHGCIFEEQCEDCSHLVLREQEGSSISFQPTGNRCPECGGVLRDTLLDWEDPLPDHQLSVSEQHCHQADLVVTLGTSLRIEPAASLPQLSAGKFVVVNLQETPYDGLAQLVIRGLVDDVMSGVMQKVFGCELSQEPGKPMEWKPCTN